MSRKYSVVLLLILVFMVAMTACSKKQTVDTSPTPDPEPQVTEPVEPEVEDTESTYVEPEVKEEPLPVLEDVFFDFDKSSLTAGAKRTLENNARQLKSASAVGIVIEGHCDQRGANAYNLALGERRAKAAKDNLGSLGIPSTRIRTVSYGEERPFEMGNNEAAWAKNRRAHFVINK